MKIVIDAFGGDNAPLEIVQGALNAIKEDKELIVSLVGDKDKIEAILAKSDADLSRVEVIDAKDVITNDDSPTMAIKTKKDSSLVKAFDTLMSSDDYQGIVSAGSTGAVLVGAFMLVGRIKGISRPALAPIIPTVKGSGAILCDCGANVDCKPIQLLHFGIMASAYAKAAFNIDSPRVALLSNGTEDSKGTELNQEAFKLLSECDKINFVGNCEGRDFMTGDLDVIVADGFNGNVALKTAEGTANAIMTLLKSGVMEGGLKAKLGALLIKPVLREVKHKLDYNQTGGAVFLGVNKIVVKAHGSSGALAIKNAIKQAKNLAEQDIITKIKSGIE